MDDEEKIKTLDGKFVVSKREIYHTLCNVHSATAHRGRDKTNCYLRNSYAGISQEVVTLFVSLCKLHQQQKSVTNHLKKTVTNPIKANFLSHVEIDLIDFRSSNERSDKVGSEATEIHNSSEEGEIIMGTIMPYDHEPLMDSDDDSENESDINEYEDSRTSWN